MKLCILYALSLIPNIEDVLEGWMLEEEEAVRSSSKKPTGEIAENNAAPQEHTRPDQSRFQHRVGGFASMIGRETQKENSRFLIPGGFVRLPSLVIP